MKFSHPCTAKPLCMVSEGMAINKRTWENDNFGKVVYMGNVCGREKVNNTCENNACRNDG
jgi:hypothetical protein